MMQLTRRPQERYGRQITKILTEGGIAALEGACGLGKSWGYLLPALQHGGRTLVTTSSLSHLDQLRRDLQRHAPPDSWHVLKGHAAYLCIDAEARTDLERLFPDWAPRIGEWAATTSTGELDELPGIPKAVRDILSCSGTECRQDDCRYRDAARHSAGAKIVLSTHHNILTRMRYDLLGCAPLASDDPTGTISSLIIDESHLLEAAASTTYGDDVPLYDPGSASSCNMQECQRLSDAPLWFSRLQMMVKLYTEQWQQLLNQSSSVATKAAGHRGQTLNELIDEVRQTARKDLDKLYLGPALKAVRNTLRAESALGKLQRAQDALDHSAPAGNGRFGGSDAQIPLTLVTPHHEYLDITDGKLVLRPSNPAEIVQQLVHQYRATVLTSATIDPAPSGVEVTRYGTPYELQRQIKVMHVDRSCPPRPKYIHGRADNEGEAHRARYVASSVQRLAKDYQHIMILVTSKQHAERLALLIPGAEYERDNYGPDRVAEAIREGGCGIWYSWHGVDLPSSSKLLVLERCPFPPPSRAAAALAAVTRSNQAAGKSAADLRQKVLQGYGRAIRSELDNCTVVLGEAALLNSAGDPRGSAVHEAA